MNSTKKFLLTAVTCLVAPLAFADQEQPAAKEMPKDTPKFEELDKDANGGISAVEATNTWLAESFSKADANQDGNVTKDEYEDATG